MQPHSIPRSIRPPCLRRSLTVFALTLAILALAMPLGASAADEKDDPRRDTPRREETPEVQVIDAHVAPADTGQTHFVASDPDPEPVCPPGFEPAQPPFNPALGCVATDLAPASPEPDPACPEGFGPAEPPLNPALGCLPTDAASGSGGSAGGDPGPICPEGFVPALPPLNPELGCIASAEAIAVNTRAEPQTATLAGGGDARHPGHDDCPPGWVPALSPLNEDLGCINNTLTAGAVAGDASGGVFIDSGSGGGTGHPGHGCPEGYVQKLLLKQNPDGSLTFFYGCVKEGGGIVTGPTDISSGASEPVVAYVSWTGPDVLTVPPCLEGSARHPYYPEYGCIPYGSGPWAL